MSSYAYTTPLENNSKRCNRVLINDFKDKDYLDTNVFNNSISYKSKDFQFKAMLCKSKSRINVIIEGLDKRHACDRNVSSLLTACSLVPKSKFQRGIVNLSKVGNIKETLKVNIKKSSLPTIALECSNESYVFVCSSGDWYQGFFH